MKNIKKFAGYVISNGIFVAAGIYGLVYGVTFAKNIFLFMAWISIALECVMTGTALTVSRSDAADRETLKARLRKNMFGKKMHMLHVGYESVVVLALAGYGHFFTGFFYATTILLLSFRRKAVQKESTPKESGSKKAGASS